jgi:glutamine amidotransferase
MIAIVDYGSGNIRAIENIFNQINVKYLVVRNPLELDLSVSKIILPGVGAFDESMRTLSESGFIERLNEKVIVEKTPVLGICVGMQLMANESEEGQLRGLGWIPGRVKKLPITTLNNKPFLPHMGWNSILRKLDCPLLDGIRDESDFYFIHSYYYECERDSDIMLQTQYGIIFTSAVNNGHIYGVQFHPEKSHSNGIKLLRNFSQI